jgi:fluoride ion exporter CrcB/FEX
LPSRRNAARLDQQEADELSYRLRRRRHWRRASASRESHGGVSGGFTTCSAFSLETVMFYKRSQWASAAAYVVASVAISAAARLAGLALVRNIAG